MKKISLIIITSLSLASGIAMADIANGGAVHFTGEVVNAACTVDAGSIDQTVQLGQIRAARLAKKGDMSMPVNFNIELNDCGIDVSTKASVAFTGVPIDSANPTVMELQSSASGGAKNVGIQILDKKGNPLGLDGTVFSPPVTLNNGTNVIPFQARYFATNAAVAGTANADATFKVQYE